MKATAGTALSLRQISDAKLASMLEPANWAAAQYDQVLVRLRAMASEGKVGGAVTIPLTITPAKTLEGTGGALLKAKLEAEGFGVTVVQLEGDPSGAVFALNVSW